MEIRYLGFDQRQNFRVYRFEARASARETKEVSVTADIAVFRDHRVGIQEGPSLCGNKLAADLERGWEGEHELTADDVRAYAEAKATADAGRAGGRKPPRHPPGPPTETQPKTRWRNFVI